MMSRQTVCSPPERQTMTNVQPPVTRGRQRRRDSAISLGDEATLEQGPEPLDLLMHPLAGAASPLGRGIHPMTTVPLGLAIDAAIEACGGYSLEVTTLRYCTFSMEAPTSNRRALRATGRVATIGRRHVEVAVEVWEDSRLILQGRIGLVRVRGRRAASLEDRTAVG